MNMAMQINTVNSLPLEFYCLIVDISQHQGINSLYHIHACWVTYSPFLNVYRFENKITLNVSRILSSLMWFFCVYVCICMSAVVWY